MSTLIRLIFAAVVAVASCQVTASADVIFSNVLAGNQGITTSQQQFGGEVTAAGTSRTVTELNIGFDSQNLPVTADLQAFLYANDGTGGSPGTLLWSSAVMSGVNLDTANLLFSFVVPSVVVPNTFTWTSAITNASGLLGYVPETVTTTGTFDQAWDGSPGSWQALPAGFETEAQVFAVPEPSAITLAFSSVPFVMGYWLLRRRRAA